MSLYHQFICLAFYFALWPPPFRRRQRLFFFFPSPRLSVMAHASRFAMIFRFDSVYHFLLFILPDHLPFAFITPAYAFITPDVIYDAFTSYVDTPILHRQYYYYAIVIFI